MHSHARTLLSKLGFADVDRKSPRHDLACSYLALRPAVLKAVLQSAMPDGVFVESASGELEFPIQKGAGQYATTIGWVDVWATFRVRQAQKMASPAPFDLRDNESAARDYLMKAPRFDAHIEMTLAAVIEVKIGRVGVGDLVRQLKLYNEYRPRPGRVGAPGELASFHTEAPGWPSEAGLSDAEYRVIGTANAGYFWHHSSKAIDRLREDVGKTLVACCDFDMDAEYVRSLKASGIHPVRLGAGFERFVREQESQTEEAPEVLAV